MIRIIILVICIILMTMGCSVPTSEHIPASADKQQAIPKEGLVEKLNNITENNLEINAKEIDFNLPQNYYVSFAERIGKNLIVSIMERETIHLENKNRLFLIKYDLQNQSHKIIYQGEGDTYTDTFKSRIKVLQNGNIAFFASNKLLIFSKGDLILISEINFPKHTHFYYDVSPDGSKIVMNHYSDNKNLALTDWKFLNWKCLVERVKGSDSTMLEDKFPSCPIWSKDGARISYVVYFFNGMEEWGRIKGVGVIDIDGNNNNLFTVENLHFTPSYTYWMENYNSILAVQEEREPQAYLITLSNGYFRKLELPESFLCLIPNPIEQNAVYIADNQVYVYDLESNKSKQITSVKDKATGIQWDVTGRELVVLIKNKIKIITL